MFDAIGKLVLLTDFAELLRRVARTLKLASRSREDKERIALALKTIQMASLKSRNFITLHGFVRSEELTDMWLDAMHQVVAAGIGDGLPDYLYHKAQFWGRPQDWIDNPTTLELVPRLNEIDEQCDALLKLLK